MSAVTFFWVEIEAMILYDNDILNDLLLSLHLYDNLSE